MEWGVSIGSSVRYLNADESAIEDRSEVGFHHWVFLERLGDTPLSTYRLIVTIHPIPWDVWTPMNS